MILYLAVSVEHRLVTDRQQGHSKYRASIASRGKNDVYRHELKCSEAHPRKTLLLALTKTWNNRLRRRRHVQCWYNHYGAVYIVA